MTYAEDGTMMDGSLRISLMCYISVTNIAIYEINEV